MVDTGSTYLGLPQEEIECLGLPQGLGIVRLMTATGVAELSPYFANGELYGQTFSALLVPMESPVIGYELLQNLRYKVNPVTHEIEKVPDDVRHPPFL
jgi:predicted aspartyl protease